MAHLASFPQCLWAYLLGGMAIDFRYFDLINVMPFFLAGIVTGFPSQQPSVVVLEQGSGSEAVAATGPSG